MISEATLRAAGRRTHAPDGCTLYVAPLGADVTADDVRDAVRSKAPEAPTRYVVRSYEGASRRGSRDRRYCFVEFRTADAAREALERLQGMTIASRPVRVSYAHHTEPQKNDT